MRRSPLRRAKAVPKVSAKRETQRMTDAEVRKAVFLRDQMRCQFPHHLRPDVPCRGGLSVHHLLKASHGGPFVPGNLLTLCVVSNDWVEDNPEDAYELGLVVRSWEAGHFLERIASDETFPAP